MLPLIPSLERIRIIVSIRKCFRREQDNMYVCGEIVKLQEVECSCSISSRAWLISCKTLLSLLRSECFELLLEYPKNNRTNLLRSSVYLSSVEASNKELYPCCSSWCLQLETLECYSILFVCKCKALEVCSRYSGSLQ